MPANAIKKIKSLSPREKEIAIYIAEGLSTTIIANNLGIKSNTVSTIKNRIYIKMGVNSSIALFKALNSWQ